MRKVTVDRKATLQYKLIQIVGCAGDKLRMGKMEETMKQTYEMKRRLKEAGLSFNVNKKNNGTIQVQYTLQTM